LGRDNVVHLALTDPAAAGRIAVPLQRLMRFLGQAAETGLNDAGRTTVSVAPHDDDLILKGEVEQ